MNTKIQGLYKTIYSPQILKLLLPSLLLLFSFRPGEGTGRPKLPVIRKEVKVENHFKSVRINGDISMILTNEPAGTLMMEGNEKVLNNIRYKVRNNELTIDAHKKNRLDKLTIYLSAATLQTMQVNGDSFVSSTDVIKPDNLQIWLNGIITVNLKTIKGHVKVDAFDGYDMNWELPFVTNRK